MKRAIIVGASSGIGMEVAKLLQSDGWTIGVASRREERMRELFPDAVAMPIDVLADDAPDQLMALVEALGGVELYFHAAGIGWQNQQLETEKEVATVATNALGFTQMVDAMFGYMAEHGGGHIAVISSVAGTKGLGAAPAYSATKAFQNKYIEALEQLANMRHLNIRLTDIRPGFVDTPLLAGASFPLMMRPERVARSIVKAIGRGSSVAVVDWRWRIVVGLWRLIPRFVWRRLPVK